MNKEEWLSRLKLTVTLLTEFQEMKDLIPIIAEYVGDSDILILYSPWQKDKCHFLQLPSASQISGRSAATVEHKTVEGWDYTSKVCVGHGKILGVDKNNDWILWNVRRNIKSRIIPPSGYVRSNFQLSVERKLAIRVPWVKCGIFIFDFDLEQWTHTWESAHFGNPCLSCVTTSGLLVQVSNYRYTRGDLRFPEIRWFDPKDAKKIWKDSFVTDFAFVQISSLLPIQNDFVLLIGKTSQEGYYVFNPLTGFNIHMQYNIVLPGEIVSPCIVQLAESDRSFLAFLRNSDHCLMLAEISMSSTTVSLDQWCTVKLPFLSDSKPFCLCRWPNLCS